MCQSIYEVESLCALDEASNDRVSHDIKHRPIDKKNLKSIHF